MRKIILQKWYDDFTMYKNDTKYIQKTLSL